MMKTMILAVSAALSLGAGTSHAATIGQGKYAMTTGGSSAGAPATAPSYHILNTVRPVGPNPWDGTESWKQYDRDHPVQGGG